MAAAPSVCTALSAKPGIHARPPAKCSATASRMVTTGALKRCVHARRGEVPLMSAIPTVQSAVSTPRLWMKSTALVRESPLG